MIYQSFLNWLVKLLTIADDQDGGNDGANYVPPFLSFTVDDLISELSLELFWTQTYEIWGDCHVCRPE